MKGKVVVSPAEGVSSVIIDPTQTETHFSRSGSSPPRKPKQKISSPTVPVVIPADAGRRYPLSALEKHYSIPEIAELWQLSPDTVRELFRDAPGVIKIGSPETRHKRGYITLRVPENVVLKVHAQLRGKAAA